MPRVPLDKPPKFVWPPGLPADAPPPPASAPDASPQAHSWFRVFEEELLGRTASPFAERAADEGWHPDSPADYCPRCGACASEYEPQFGASGDLATCTWCRDKRLPWSNFVRVGAYDGLLRDAILELKFTAWRAVGMELGRLLGGQLAAELARLKVPPERVLLIPVPTTWRRRLARGVDHSLVLARGVAEVVPCRLGRPIGRRHTPSQASLAASVREQNVSGAFFDRSVRIPNVQLVVVLDDVRTTGATLRAACRAARRWLRRQTPPAGVARAAVWACSIGVTPSSLEGADGDAGKARRA